MHICQNKTLGSDQINLRFKSSASRLTAQTAYPYLPLRFSCAFLSRQQPGVCYEPKPVGSRNQDSPSILRLLVCLVPHLTRLMKLTTRSSRSSEINDDPCTHLLNAVQYPFNRRLIIVLPIKHGKFAFRSGRTNLAYNSIPYLLCTPHEALSIDPCQQRYRNMCLLDPISSFVYGFM